MSDDEPLATLTHARLRWEQGYAAEAERIVGRILQRDPDDRRAWELLERIRRTPRARESSEAEEPSPPPPVAADAAALRLRFRRELVPGSGAPRERKVRRLRAWLERIGRQGTAG